MSLARSGERLRSPKRKLFISHLIVAFIVCCSGIEAISQPCTVQIANNDFTVKPALCTGTVAWLDGTIPTGGNGSYSYQWQIGSGGCGNGSFTNIAGATFKDYALPANATPGLCYRRIVTSGSCTSTSPNKNVNSSDFTTPSAPTATVVQPTCTASTGTITITSPAADGTVSYSVDGTTYTNTSGIFTNLTPKTYSVTAKLPTGCVSPALSVILNTPATPTGTITPAAPTICAGNAITLTANSSGTSYQWFRNGQLISGATNTTFVANQAGSYSVTVTSGSCSASIDTAVVTVEPLPTGTITPAGPLNVCLGSSQVLSVGGGANYQWYKDNVSISGATGSTFNATTAGVYTADIISANGCKGKSTNSVTITVSPLPTGSITPPSATLCSGASVTLTATGGANYQWYKDGVTINNALSSTIVVNQPGRYAADIFDAGGCKGKSTNESVVTIGTTPTGTVSPATAVICSNGSVTLTATGGTTYQWYRNGTLIPGATSATYNASQTGSYTADIFSGTCQGITSNAGVITQGTAPSGTISPAAGSLCSGNSVTLTVNGGTSYQWLKDGVAISGAITAVYNATQTGTYSVTIINGGCSGPASNTVVVSSGTAITFTATPTNPSCVVTTGSVTVNNVAGGSGSGYTYSKDNGATFQASNVFTGLAPGTYQIVVKDPGGCKSNPSAVVITTFTSTLQGSAFVTNIACAQSSGTVTITASGGTSPYQYKLDTGAYTVANSFSGLSLGAHKVTVKDSVGCVVDVNFTITQTNSTLTATSNVINASCGSPNGAVTIQATGGTPGYVYSLDSNSYQIGNSFTNLSAGLHRVTVKDAAGCSFALSFTVTQAAVVPNLLITNPPKICPGTTANLEAATVTAGSDPALSYTYWKDANAILAVVAPAAVPEGTYYIKGTNAGGCANIKPVVVTLQTVFPGSITATRTTACITDSLQLTASGGRGYQWYRNDTLISGATAVSYQAKSSGVYSVSIDDGTCSVKASNTVKLEFNGCTPINDARALVPTAFTPNHNGANDVLRPVLYNVATLHYFKVYNRWGQLVYETSTIGKGWDGNKEGVPQPSDAYTWMLECIGKNGELVHASGRSVLIR